MSLAEFYDCLKIRCADVSSVTDSFGNSLVTFVPVDDIAITFAITSDGDIQSCWNG